MLLSQVNPLDYVILECGLAKKPFLGGRTGGIEEFIEEDVEGLLVEPGDKDDLKEKIITFLDNDDLSKKSN